MRAAEIARERQHPLLRHLLRLPVGGGRVRAPRLRASPTPTRPSARRTRRTRSSTSCATCSASTTSAARCGSGSYACQLAPGSLRARALRQRRDPRAPPPPLRVQLPLREGADRATGCEIVGRSLDGKFVEIVELPGASVVRRGAVPSRVQVEADSSRIRCSPASSRRATAHKLAGAAATTTASVVG